MVGLGGCGPTHGCWWGCKLYSSVGGYFSISLKILNERIMFTCLPLPMYISRHVSVYFVLVCLNEELEHAICQL